ILIPRIYRGSKEYKEYSLKIIKKRLLI
ncbi:hypothetical protein FPSE_11267, partial [Fusarium pseudograminearum CS3096]